MNKRNPAKIPKKVASLSPVARTNVTPATSPRRKFSAKISEVIGVHKKEDASTVEEVLTISSKNPLENYVVGDKYYVLAETRKEIPFYVEIEQSRQIEKEPKRTQEIERSSYAKEYREFSRNYLHPESVGFVLSHPENETITIIEREKEHSHRGEMSKKSRIPIPLLGYEHFASEEKDTEKLIEESSEKARQFSLDHFNSELDGFIEDYIKLHETAREFVKTRDQLISSYPSSKNQHEFLEKILVDLPLLQHSRILIRDLIEILQIK